jgi:calcineurin-like phosphoesterase family protein
LVRKVWFTADTHFGHKRIPFYARRMFCLSDREREYVESVPKGSISNWSPSRESLARMDGHLIDMINSSVGVDDILWHLGDFCWGKSRDPAGSARRYRSAIRCRNVFLVVGNHDREETWSAFEECHRYREIKVGSKHIVLNHYAQCFWNRSHYGSWMLYGHAHSTAEGWLDEHMPGRLSMDVGVDNVARLTGEYRPISSEEIAEIFATRKGFHVDGHKKAAPSFAPPKIGL